MARKDIIASKLYPNIPIKELWTADTSQYSEHNLVGIERIPSADLSGSVKPFIKINSVSIPDVSQLIIDETEFIPRIKLIFTDNIGALSGINYPKNDPIVSVYIKTQNPTFKSIRCDFLITTIKSDREIINNKTTGAEFVITGELYVPKIYDYVSKGYRNMTSSEALLKVAEDLDLGYASNDFSTNDMMTWINPNRNYIYFINQIANHAYSNDDTFFKAFIDKYYHLNFINVSEQLSPSNDVRETLNNTVAANTFNQLKGEYENAKDSIYDDAVVLKLSNHEDLRGRPDYIMNHSLIGDNGRILKKKGYKRQIYYYDHTIDGDKFVNFYMDPVRIEGYAKNSKSTYLIPDDETLKNSTVKKWMNIDYGNTHREWNASVLINDHNNSELDKVKLKAATAGINFQVSKGMGVPILIYQQASHYLMKNASRSDMDVNNNGKNEFSDIILDESLSGRYYVSGVKYVYNKGEEYEFKTEYFLAKMNWIGEKNIVE